MLWRTKEKCEQRARCEESSITSGEWHCFPELMCVYSARGCNFTLQRRTGFESCWLWRQWGPGAAQPGQAWASGPRQGKAGWQTMPGPSGAAQLHSIPFLHVSDKAYVPLSPESRQRRCCPGGWRGEVAQQTLGSYWNERSAERSFLVHVEKQEHSSSKRRNSIQLHGSVGITWPLRRRHITCLFFEALALSPCVLFFPQRVNS